MKLKGGKTRAWNFASGCLPDREQIEKLLSTVGWDKVRWEPPVLNFPLPGMELDLGGVVKEYAADRAASLCRDMSVKSGMVNVVFTGHDRGIQGGIDQWYERGLSLVDASRPEVLLAYAINGAPLPPQHGYPLRLIVPGWYGMTHVKWLRRISVLAEPFQGYQNVRGYRYRATEEEPGEPITRIHVRSLMLPPGIPDFMTRKRFVEAGRSTLEGRAWSGSAPIEQVEVSDDGGTTWAEARLGALPISPYAWRSWSFEWDARAGDHELCSRATDGTGETQPLEPEWNVGGYRNNSVHRVPVLVR